MVLTLARQGSGFNARRKKEGAKGRKEESGAWLMLLIPAHRRGGR